MANLLVIMLLFAGAAGLMVMIRETFPRFSLDAITVSVKYPGADPEEVEEGICLKLEEALIGLEGAKKVYSTASEGAGITIVECLENANIMKVKDEVKTRVDAITTFPTDAEKPIVEEVKFRGDVCSIILSGDLPERQLKELARYVENELLQTGKVTQTNISGIRNYEISIEIREETLRSYGINFTQVREAVTAAGLNLPAGTIHTKNEDFRIRAIGRRYRAKDYENIPIIKRKNGTIISLGQIAKIRDTFDEDAKTFSIFNGKPAVSVDIYKTENEDAVKISKFIDTYIASKESKMPPGLQMTKFRDNARIVTGRLELLRRNGIFGLILVFLSLWLFLDLRLSFWVTVGIPISLAGAIGIMALNGNSINMLTMFGMIMVLGIIVDDAIVIGEAIYDRRQKGESAEDAAGDGTAEVAMPVLASVTTTIVAFLPLFFVNGVMGKFMREIPTPVVAALCVSLLESLFILPVHLRNLPRLDEPTKIKIFRYGRIFRGYVDKSLEYFLQNIYGPLLKYILHMRYAAVSTAIAIFMIVIGLVQGGVLKFVFMPPTDDDFIRAQIEFPDGTPERVSRETVLKLVEAWKKVEDANKVPAHKKLTVGICSLVGGSFEFDAETGQSNKLDVLVELLPSEERNIYYMKLLNQWQKAVGDIPGAVATRFQSMHRGPGGNPIEVQLLGEDQPKLLQAAQELKAKLSSYKGVFDEQLDYRPGKREFIVSMKPEGSQQGLTLTDIARHIQGGFYGTEALRIQRNRDDVKVKVRYPEKEGRDSVKYFRTLRIKTPSGNMVPFLSVANIKLSEGQSTIRRQQRKRTVNVSADINNDEANASEIIEELKTNFLPGLCAKYNVSYNMEGEAKETAESLGSLYLSFPLALFGIYFIISSMFKSYIQPAVIMVTIPFGLIGAAIGHILFALPLTIMSLFGMIAVTGIVVNDAIVLIDGFNIKLGGGVPFYEALCEGSKRRFRPIMLTTITTFFGIFPMILERSMQARFLIPMAISIAFGVAFSSLLTLVLIPCLLVVLNDIRRLINKLFTGTLPEREDVEPNAHKTVSAEE